MSDKAKETWVDPDDAPELTNNFFEHASLFRGGKLIQLASGTLTRPETTVRRKRLRPVAS